jgi:hypothetical protein
MLAQFQSLYPNGSIISELVQIFQGKYIVRVSIQIENVTRATGMAGAETVEAAEDAARNRAFMVLGISNSPQTSVALTQQPPTPVPANPVLNNTKEKLNEPTYSPVINEEFASNLSSKSSGKEVLLPPVGEQNIKPEPVISHTYTQEISPGLSLTDNREPELETFTQTPMENWEKVSDTPPENLSVSENFASNVKQFTPRSSTPVENITTQTGGGRKKKKSEPVDLSDVIAKTDVELQRLGWTPEQGREYLIKTYGKRGRTLLTEDELHDFLRHLELQPDPIAGF